MRRRREAGEGGFASRTTVACAVGLVHPRKGGETCIYCTLLGSWYQRCVTVWAGGRAERGVHDIIGLPLPGRIYAEWQRIPRYVQRQQLRLPVSRPEWTLSACATCTSMEKLCIPLLLASRQRLRRHDTPDRTGFTPLVSHFARISFADG